LQARGSVSNRLLKEVDAPPSKLSTELSHMPRTLSLKGEGWNSDVRVADE